MAHANDYIKRALKGCFKSPGEQMYTDNYCPGGEMRLHRERVHQRKGAWWKDRVKKYGESQLR